MILYMLAIVFECHGGVDSGAVSGNLKEKDFTLQAANYMYIALKNLVYQ